MKFFTKEAKIGLAGIIALGMLIYGINYLKGVDIFNPSKYIYVKYSNINGLIKSSPVFADGFKVGTVSDIHYDYNNPGNIIVQIELDEAVRIPKGSYGELRMDMLGSSSMHILLSNNMRESYQVGDTIPGVVNGGVMDILAKDFIPAFETMMPKIDSILTSLNALLADGRFDKTLTSVQNTAANLERTTAGLNRMMNNDVPQAISKLNKIEDNVLVITDNLAGIDFRKTMDEVDRTISNVNEFTAKLNSKDNTIGLLLNDKSLYNNLNSTAENASELLSDLKKNPKRYVHFSVFGKKDCKSEK